jgi:hypothetical protein
LLVGNLSVGKPIKESELNGDAIADFDVTSDNLLAFLRNGDGSRTISANFAGGGSYSGIVSAVPEPSSALLLAFPALGFYATARRKRRSV